MQQPNDIYAMYPRPCGAGEFIYVCGEDMARRYPLTPGAVGRFIDTTCNYSYIKRMQYDGINFEFTRVKMVPEAPPVQQVSGQTDFSNFVTQDQLNDLNGKLDTVLAALSNQKGNYQGKNRDRERSMNNAE